MTPNPTNNQAEKHSAGKPFPWSIGRVFEMRVNEWLIDIDFRGVAQYMLYGSSKDALKWRANNLIDSLNFPKSDHLVSLTAELSTLRKELESIKARTAIQAIERLVKTCCSQCGHDTTEDGCANCLKLELEAAKIAVEFCEGVDSKTLEDGITQMRGEPNVGPLKSLIRVADERQITIEDYREAFKVKELQLEAEKKARCWIENHITVENSIQILPMKAIHELRELLNNGKDGKCE